MKKIILLILGLICLIFSCEKEEQIEASTYEMLTKNQWQLDAIFVKPNFFGSDNIYDSLVDCKKDDIVYFNSNGKQEVFANLIKCYPSEPDIDSAISWKLVDNIIITSFQDGSKVFTDTLNIISLNEKQLQLKIFNKVLNVNYEFVYQYHKF